MMTGHPRLDHVILLLTVVLTALTLDYCSPFQVLSFTNLQKRQINDFLIICNNDKKEEKNFNKNRKLRLHCRKEKHRYHRSMLSATVVNHQDDIIVNDSITAGASKSAITATEDEEKEEYLDFLLKEALFRTSFFMETDYLLQTTNKALRSLFQTCIDCVYIDKSTIPQAGRGLFASHDIPKGTIVAFYPVHFIGFRFQESGLCNSVGLPSSSSSLSSTDDDKQGGDFHVESSSYTLNSFTNRKLCGIDLCNDLNLQGNLFVDMNPNKKNQDGWACGFINDGAIVQSHNDTNYYLQSKSCQNVEIVPFSTAPFHVGVTTKDVKEGQELFVSYGFSYWYNGQNFGSIDSEWKPKSNEIVKQEEESLNQLLQTIEMTEGKYADASWTLSYLFNHMNSQDLLPPLSPPPYPFKGTTRVEKKNGGNGSRRSRFVEFGRRIIQQSFNRRKKFSSLY
jgi:hypothetical protein